MKILVIGASGYLGNTIYKKLKEDSNDDIYPMTTRPKTPIFFKWELRAATSLDNDFYASGGVKTPSEAKNSVYGTCCNSSNEGLLKINVLDKLDINKILAYKPDIIIWSIYDLEQEMSLSQIGLNEIVNGISEDVRLIYVSTTVGQGRDQTEEVIPHKRMPEEYNSKYVSGKIQGGKSSKIAS